MCGERESKSASRRGAQRALMYGLLAAGALGFVVLALLPHAPADPRSLVKPMLAMVVVTTAVWLAMASVRNWAILTGRASPKHYLDYKSDPPPDWIERPARAYDNLMQAPTLFYVISILMIVTGWADSTQVTLAWMFVALRAAHAVIYIGVNVLPARFVSFALSCFALWEMWARFALNAG